MKYYNIFADRNFQKKGWVPGVNYEQILSVHDECQWEVDEDIAEEFAREAERSFDDVTEYLKFRIPIRGTADVGDNWSQTH
jgi:DNA polymerase I-like protein with 3'-5' exonuclease and polymerase domains